MMTSFLTRLFEKADSPSNILCPHCERSLAEHDVEACTRRRMSRRFFFGVLGGAAVVAAMPAMPELGPYTVEIITGPPYVLGPMILTPEAINHECLMILGRELREYRELQRYYNAQMSAVAETFTVPLRII